MDNTSDIQTDKFLYEHALGALNGLAIGDKPLITSVLTPKIASRKIILLYDHL